jgi:hypothetical protein
VTYFAGDATAFPTTLLAGPALLSGPALLAGAALFGPSSEAMRQPAAAIIQRCYRWLEAVAPVLPQVASIAPGLVTAVQQYAARQYAASFRQSTVVVQAVNQLRAAVPGLPPL